MKWLLLISVVACSSQNTTVKPNLTPAEKPASPLTVRPCFCMKIYQPVCAAGVSYGNSCEAECNGHKTWDEGACSQKKK